MENNATDLMPQSQSSVVAIEQTRSIAETQAMFALAKRFPRDTLVAYNRIMKACQRKTLAEQAIYAYPRGGQMVQGPTIRLLEALAQNWGNIDFGLNIDQREDESLVTAYAVDLETNVRRTMKFMVKHVRDTRQGPKKLTDERDIYEIASNMGSRRLRKCLEGIIPGDILEDAERECDKTLKGDGKEPIEDRIRKLLVIFTDSGVTKEMLEKRLQHKLEATTATELVALGKIIVSLKNGMTKPSDWFEFETAPKADDAATGSGASALSAAIKEKTTGKKPDEPQQG